MHRAYLNKLHYWNDHSSTYEASKFFLNAFDEDLITYVKVILKNN